MSDVTDYKGSYSISDLLNATRTSAKAFGFDAIARTLAGDLMAYNKTVNDAMSAILERSTDVQRASGASSKSRMQPLDEFGRANTQKVPAGYNIGFPLERYGLGVGWTDLFLRQATPADLAKVQQDAKIAHSLLIKEELQKALLRKTNLSTYRDHLVDNITLPVFRFVNADGNAIPNGPNGETFTASTHDHYLSTGTAANADWVNLVETVAEHGHTEDLRMYIARADRATVEALSDFTALTPVYIARDTIAASAGVPIGGLDETKLDNVHIGYFKGAQVWVKDWIPTSYSFCFAAGDDRKPAVFRELPMAEMQGLRAAAENEDYPLHITQYDAHFGIGVWTRTNGAVLYTGNDTWADAV